MRDLKSQSREDDDGVCSRSVAIFTFRDKAFETRTKELYNSFLMLGVDMVGMVLYKAQWTVGAHAMNMAAYPEKFGSLVIHGCLRR